MIMLVRPTFGSFKISTLGGGEGEIKPMLYFYEDQRARNKSSGSHNIENRTYSVNMRAAIIRNAMTRKQNPFRPTRRNSG